MNELFISYAREDRDVVSRIVQRLTAAGCSVWWDQDIPYGQTWDSYTGARLAAARCVVVIWTAESVKSRWVRAEANIADQRGAILPVILGNVMPPPPFNLSQSVMLSVPVDGGNDTWIAPLVSAVEKFELVPIDSQDGVNEISAAEPRANTRVVVARTLQRRNARILAAVALGALAVAGGWYVTHRPHPSVAEVNIAPPELNIANDINEASTKLDEIENNPVSSGRVESGKLEAIRVILDRALAGKADSSQQIQLRKLKAQWLRLHDGTDVAINYCKQAIKEHPNNSLLYAELGALYLSGRQQDQAIVQLEKSIELNNDPGGVASAGLNLGNIYYGRQEPALAKESFRAALRSGRNQQAVCNRLKELVGGGDVYGDMAADVEADCP